MHRLIVHRIIISEGIREDWNNSEINLFNYLTSIKATKSLRHKCIADSEKYYGSKRTIKNISGWQEWIINIVFEFLNIKVFLKSRNRKKDSQETNGNEENSRIELTLIPSNIKCKMMRRSWQFSIAFKFMK